MGRRKAPNGICCLCGEEGPLSYEHVPPRAAFNNRPIVEYKGDEIIRLSSEEVVRGHKNQRGAGGFTLCPRCNNKTGSWYGGHFVLWCYQGMDILVRSGGHPTLYYMYKQYPLAIIKQIVTMFFSANGHKFREKAGELERFVLNREARHIPSMYRFFAYYNIEGGMRSTGIMGQFVTDGSNQTIMSDISFPPFGYLMTIDSRPPDPRLFDITHFADYRFDEFAVKEIRLPVLPTHTPYAGDYRTQEDLHRDREENLRRMKEMEPSPDSGL